MTQQQEAVNALDVLAAHSHRENSVFRALSPWRRQPLGVVGGLIVIFVVTVAIVAPMVAPYDPKDFVGRPLESPSSQFLLGTNNLGEDVLSRTIIGAQVSIAVGMTATFLAVFMGSTMGVISGYVGGWLDLVIQRLLEVVASFPGLILAVMVIAAVGRPHESGSNLLLLTWQLRSLEIAIAISFVFGNMRIIRSAVIRQRNMPYIEAAASIGAGTPRILFHHVLPNVFHYIIITFSTIVGIVIIIEAALSFLGFGVEPGTASWGADLSNRNREFFLSSPLLMAGPAVALSLTVLGFNFLGDALRDILDPRLRGNR